MSEYVTSRLCYSSPQVVYVIILHKLLMKNKFVSKLRKNIGCVKESMESTNFAPIKQPNL